MLSLPGLGDQGLSQPYQYQKLDDNIIKVIETRNMFLSCNTSSPHSGQTRKLVA